VSEFDLLVHGDVWDAVDGRRTDRWIAINDGEIEGVYEDDPGSAAETRAVDLVTPGLIDMHVHLVWDGSADPVATLRKESEQELVVRAIENGNAQVHGGVTTVRDLGSVADIATTVARAIRTGRIDGPRVHASGRTIIITGGHDPFWGIESDTPEACRQAVRELRAAGADLIKVSATGGVYGQAIGEEPGASELSSQELSAVVEEASRFDLPVAAHAVGRAGIENAIEAGVDTIEHGNLMSEASLSAIQERDVAYDPTLFVYRQIAEGDADIPEYARENARDVVDSHRAVAASAIDSDARILAGSDAGSPHTPHPSIHRELIDMVEVGADEATALEAATLSAARELGRPELGTVAAGTPADLVGFDADPLEEIAVTETPAVVIRDGSIVG
jgi:imidazolonepropionase-like amidohydrolase